MYIERTVMTAKVITETSSPAMTENPVKAAMTNHCSHEGKTVIRSRKQDAQRERKRSRSDECARRPRRTKDNARAAGLEHRESVLSREKKHSSFSFRHHNELF